MRVLWQLLFTFSKIGAFTFGGGYAMIPAIRRETVENRNWIDEEGIADCIAICQSLPGAFAVNVAIFIGKRVKGIAGALFACFGIVFPSFLAITIIVIFLNQFEENVYIIGALEGMKAASVALILVTVYQLSRNILKNVTGFIIAVLSFVLIVFLDVSAIFAIILGGLIGFIEYKIRKGKK
ncbi:MAG: chromate transporter [Clostridiales bacterium]|jgi:chromate transporter|nr:chromate transporter [Clostridiales bacterium]